MALVDNPSTWEESLIRLQLCSSSHAAEATTNTLILDVHGAVESAEIVSETTRLLRLALEHYTAKALAQGLHGIFYCWFDEISSTVRCSFSTSTTHEELPFGCKLRLLSDLREVAAQVREAEHHGEIPFEELQDEDWDDSEDDDEGFTLALWIARVPGEVSMIT